MSANELVQMGAISFIENIDRSSLTITAEEFERNVEAAVAAIAERPPPPPSPPPPSTANNNNRPITPSNNNAAASSDSNNGEITDEKAAVTGLLRTIQKPLSTIGRIFSDDTQPTGPAVTPQPGNTPRASPGIDGNDALLTAVGGRRHRDLRRGAGESGQQQQQQQQQPRPRLTAEDAAARQASAEAEEARRIGRMEYENVVEILKGMFPGLDKDVIGDVVRMKEGR